MKKFIATALLLLCCTLGFAQEIAADSPYEVLLSDRTFTFSFVSLIKGIVGMGVIVFVCWCFSSDRKNINWGTVGKALLMQVPKNSAPESLPSLAGHITRELHLLSLCDGFVLLPMEICFSLSSIHSLSCV